MKRSTLILIAIVVGLLIGGCSSSSSTSEELDDYISNVLPIMDGHADITEQVNQANLNAQTAMASGDAGRAIAAFRNYTDKLARASSSIRSELDQWKRIIPPEEARALHSKIQDGWLKEMEGLDDLHLYYSDIINYGKGNNLTLTQGNTLLRDAWETWQEVRNELNNLAKKSDN